MSDDLPIGPDVDAKPVVIVHDDDRVEIEAMGIYLVSERERRDGVRLVEARIVRRTRSVLVARVVLEHPRSRKSVLRATRAMVVLLMPSGAVLRCITVRSPDLAPVIEGFSSIAAYVEDHRPRDPRAENE